LSKIFFIVTYFIIIFIQLLSFRFDKLLYLGVSQDHESQLKIIQALTRKYVILTFYYYNKNTSRYLNNFLKNSFLLRFRLHPSLDLGVVAKRCPFNYTGADFYALCSDAMLKAMSRTAEAIEIKVGT
jgi:peroxin-6